MSPGDTCAEVECGSHRWLADCPQFVIAYIQARDVSVGLRRIPFGFLILVQSDGRRWRTANKPTLTGSNSVEWRDTIPLPTDFSARVHLTVSASFEFAAMLGRGEVLRTVEMSVSELLDHSERGLPVIFSPMQEEVVSPCSSLLVRVERRKINDLRHVLSRSNSFDFEEDPMLARITDRGHDALLLYQQHQRVEDLKHSLRHFDHALEICPRDHRCRASVLFNLATAKFITLYRADGTPSTTFDESISLYRAALDLRGLHHPDRPTTLLYLALVLVFRFGNGGDSSDANEVSRLLAEVRGLCTPNSYQHRYLDLVLQTCAETGVMINLADSTITYGTSMLTRLGSAFWGCRNRFPGFGLPGLAFNIASTLVRALAAAREYWGQRVIPANPVDEMMGFAAVLSQRYDQLEDLADLNLLVSASRITIEGTPTNHPERSNRLACFSSASFERYKRLGNVLDLDEAISSGEEAARVTPRHPDPSMVLSHLSATQLERFTRFGLTKDLHKAISASEEAVHLAPRGHSRLHMMRSRLSNALRHRFERLGNVGDLRRAISECEEAEQLIPRDHPEMHIILNNLSIAFCIRFQRYGDIMDLDKAISKGAEAIQMAPQGQSSMPTCLSNLAISLFSRFDRTGNIADIDKAISFGEQAVRLTACGHPDMPDWLNNLSAALLRRFTYLHDTADVDKAILSLERAVKNTPSGHPDLHGRLHSLGVASIKRYDRLDHVVDLERAISAGERGLQVTPHEHPDRHRMFDLLGIALHARFRRFKDVADIDRSILLGEEGMNSTPRQHPYFPDLLSNHSNRLVARFNELGNVADIDKGISVATEAMEVVPEDHPNVPMILRDLGLAFLRRFEQLGDRSDIHSAITNFSRAACCPIGSSSVRFRASLQWILCARKAEDESLLNAYSRAITLLPQVAWIGLPLKDRYHELLLAVDVVRDAAAAALELGYGEIAVEWLEQGRSVVWGQIFQLRTPIDDLRIAYPDFADRLEQTSSKLEHANSSFDQLTSQHTTETLEQCAQQHRALVLERDRLLDHIRTMPGFQQFLLPKPFSQLRASAHSGPVVVLNASEQRCDALIVTKDSDKVHHVPLLGMSYKHAEYLRSSLDASLTHHGRGTNERGARPVRTHGMNFILAELWKNVVKPVLRALNLVTPVSGEQPRIFWCPTGPLAFLPIHAAGVYQISERGNKVSDFVISSYAPTLNALTLPPERNVPNHFRLLVVLQPPSDGQTPLSGTRTEIKYIREVVSNLSSKSTSQITIIESDGAVEQVMSAMKDSDWVHFACHGKQDASSPTDSGLCLADGRRLRLSDITSLSRPRGGLAFLSACQTAAGDKALPEEAVHLAAGMLLAGYGGVIGTMWSIQDNVAPGVAKDVYEQLLRRDGTPDYREAARALHGAVERLYFTCHAKDDVIREAWFLSWVPFIHVGL